MIDALRGLLNRPLTDADRPRLFIATLAIMAAAAAVLSLAGDRPARTTTTAHQAAGPAAPPAPSIPATAPTPAPAPAVAPEAEPSEEGRPDRSVGSRADIEAVKRAARRFLAGDLPFAYRRRHGRRIAAATPRLLHELAVQRPRVPPGEARRHPRVVLLQSDGAGRRRANLTALVSDGARRYTVTLALARSRAAWVVTDVGN